MNQPTHTPADILTLVSAMTQDQIEKAYAYLHHMKFGSDPDSVWDDLFTATPNDFFDDMLERINQQEKHGLLKPMFDSQGNWA